MSKHRAVRFGEDVVRDDDPEVGIDPEEVSVEGRMMESAKAESVRDAGFAVGARVRDDVGDAPELILSPYAEIRLVGWAAQAMTRYAPRAKFLPHLEQRGKAGVDASEALCDFFEVDSLEEIEISDRPRVILVSGGFGTELTTAVLWLNEGGLDVRCVEARPYRVDETLLLDVRQVIPLPEAADYQVQKREKTTRKKALQQTNRDLTKYDFEANEKKQERLPKRQLILAIVQHLIEQGASPVEIQEAAPGRRLFRVLKGHHDQESFVSTSNADRVAKGRSPDAFRFSTEDENLIYADDHTYALTLMWGLKTEATATQLKKAFPEAGFEFRRSRDGQAD